MPDNVKLAALVALTIASEARTRYKHRKYRALVAKTYDILVTQIADQSRTIEYLCTLLDEHGIEVDEFDRIALNFTTTEKD